MAIRGLTTTYPSLARQPNSRVRGIPAPDVSRILRFLNITILDGDIQPILFRVALWPALTEPN